MPRTIPSLWLAVALTTAATGCTADTPATTAPTVIAANGSVLASKGDDDDDDDDRDDEHDDARPVTYALIGDVPYEPRTPETALSLFPTLIQSINADPQVSRAIHLGDIKSGSTVCSDQWFQTIASAFTTFADPLVYAIGDNEWTDCHRANNGGYNPVERLTKIREIFFAKPGKTLGGKRKHVDAQRGYPENQGWMASRVAFATFHVVGSNNGLDPWFGDRQPTPGETPAETAARQAEYAGRNAANIAWLDRTFEQARDENAAGVVLMFQADLWHPGDRAAGAEFSGHVAFLTRLATLAAQFKRPVLLIAGDSHDYRVDVGVPWFSLYGLTPLGNVTQLIVDRSIEADVDWLRLTVDPKSPGVFSWTQVFVP